MQEIGVSFTDKKKEDSDKIDNIMTNWKSIMYSLPMLVPKIPKLSVPSFNSQPYEGIKEGINSLRVPFKIEGETYRMSINFPKVEIPFVDPLAGICCVWEQLKKLLDLVMIAIEPPKKFVEKIFNNIKEVCKYIKEVVIMRLIRSITKVIGATTYPVIGLLEGVKGFLNGIHKIPGVNVSGPKRDIQNIINKLNNFKTGNFIGGNNYASIENKEDLTLNDIFYKIHLLDYEDKIDKKCDNVLKKLSIYKFYKIQVSKKQGLIRFVNRHKKNQFKKFKNKKFAEYKKNPRSTNYIDKYTSAHTKLMNKKMQKQIDKIKNTTYDNYDLNKNIEEDIGNNSSKIVVVNNYNNISELRTIKNLKQHGGLPSVSDALNSFNRAKDIVNKLTRAISSIPSKINIICSIVDLILDKVQIIVDLINRIKKIITDKIEGFVEKIKKLIIYVQEIAQWFMVTVVKKGIGIIEAATDLVSKIGEPLPAGISTAIFKPVKVFFAVIIGFLKLPFAQFFFTIVEILMQIPNFFNTIIDTIRSLCRTFGGTLKNILNKALGPAKEVMKEAEKIWRYVKSLVPCFGSTTSVKTTLGDKIIGDLIIGDNVLTWNNVNKIFEYQPILYIRNHFNIDKSTMKKITTNCGDIVILSNQHRVFTSDDKTKKLEDLDRKELLKTIEGKCFITKEQEFIDTPLSPIVLNGSIVTTGGTIISCWTGDDKNVKFMEKLMKLVKEYVKTHSIQETRDTMHNVYEKCVENNKNPDSIPNILKELSLNNYIKYL
jgi:hypothetical protein